jgi:hypothetical protein
MDGWQADFLLSFIEKSVVIGTDIYFEIFRGKNITCSYRYRHLLDEVQVRKSKHFQKL